MMAALQVAEVFFAQVSWRSIELIDSAPGGRSGLAGGTSWPVAAPRPGPQPLDDGDHPRPCDARARTARQADNTRIPVRIVDRF